MQCIVGLGLHVRCSSNILVQYIQCSLQSLMSSMSVAQLPSVESPAHALRNLREHFGADSVHTLTAPYHISDLSLNNSAGNLISVQLPETGASPAAYRQMLTAVGKYCQPLMKLL